MNDKELQILNYDENNYGYIESKFLNINEEKKILKEI